MPSVYACKDDCTSELGKIMQGFRSDRPSEWMMDDFIREADSLDSKLNDALDMLDDRSRAFLLDKWS